uniref:Uncharacterized protein n=1 Tax=Kalanchoe fedtschenkoi TaxID=63787 RepID=A0A7N0RE12_KALFE
MMRLLVLDGSERLWACFWGRGKSRVARWSSRATATFRHIGGIRYGSESWVCVVGLSF